MPNLKLRLPVEYIYMDVPGIESLYAQIVDAIETSRTTTTQNGLTANVGVGIRLKNLLVKLLSGVEGEASGEVTGSHARIEQSTRVPRVEHRLERVLDFLGRSKDEYFFTSLSDASRRLEMADGHVFVNIRDNFNAPQFYGYASGVDSVNSTGYLLLEKGGAADYNHHDDYYKQLTGIVKLSASTQKMRTGGVMAATSHEARYFRGFAGRHVPLGVFGSLSGTPEYMQIKPFAIWR